MSKKVKIRERMIYNYCKPYIIAEIGANHNGDITLAKESILAAKKAGADAAKFQSWTNSSLISKEEYDRNQSYDDCVKKHFGSLHEMVDKYALKESQHFELKEYCESIGLDFCSTPFSEAEADLLEKLDVPFYKLASMDINNLRLIRHVARKSKPLILSTGMATLEEIDRAVRAIEDEGNTDIIILHCISIYPPAMEDINLRNITMLQSTYDYPIGFSDHSIGTSIPLASVSLGACVIEKHFTLDKDLPGWDHAISADPTELKFICENSSNIYIALGGLRRIVSAAELGKKEKFRRSIVSTRDLKKGDVIKVDDITFKRPGTGISPELEGVVVGRSLKRSKNSDQLILWDDLK